MKKISLLTIFGLITAVSASSLMAARFAPVNQRPAVFADPAARQMVHGQVTGTITADVEEPITATVNFPRQQCLAVFGNFWASRAHASPMGIPVAMGPTLTEELDENGIASAELNACFATVSMRSRTIDNINMIAPPLLFQTGMPLQCGSWVQEQVLNDAILDAGRSARVAGTIAAGIGGAAVGFVLTDLIANVWLGLTSDRGFATPAEEEELIRQLRNVRVNDAAAWNIYVARINTWNDVCTHPNCIAAGCAANEACMQSGVSSVELARIVNRANTDQ